MKRLFMLTFLLQTATACADPSLFEVGGKIFYLANHSNACQLVNQSDNAKFDLPIPWPCQAHKNTVGQIRVHEERGKQYFLIESSVPHPELPNDCKTQLQAVLIHEGAVHLSEFTDMVASCPPFQWDAKVFTALFRDR